MAATLESTVIAWDENTLQSLGFQESRDDWGLGGNEFSAWLPAAEEAIDPFPWDGGMPQHCHDNVTHMVSQFGGKAVFGWALADVGPLSLRGKRLPLYARWINHVVWRDGRGKLWEVTPRFEVGDVSRIGWRATTFAADDQARFVVNDNEESQTLPARFVALRAEGEAVAALLNRAEHAPCKADRTTLLRRALGEMASRGFRPRECRVETIGTRTNNIWLIAE